MARGDSYSQARRAASYGQVLQPDWSVELQSDDAIPSRVQLWPLRTGHCSSHWPLLQVTSHAHESEHSMLPHELPPLHVMLHGPVPQLMVAHELFALHVIVQPALALQSTVGHELGWLHVKVH